MFLSVPQFALLLAAALVLTSTSANDLLEFPPMDGCRYIFLDVGSNIGMHARFLFEPELYSDQKYTDLFFDKYFPKEDRIKRRDMCVVGFEPNPRHRHRLQRLQTYYRSLGLRVHWFFAGVGVENGQKTFVRDNRNTGRNSNSNNNDWGYRAVVSNKEQQTMQQKVHSSNDTDISMSKDRVNVDFDVDQLTIIRFSDFIRDKVLNRIIPKKKMLSSDPPPAVVAKIDIENEEYAVLTDLLRGGDTSDTADPPSSHSSSHSPLFCAITAISIEYHYYNEQTKSVAPAPRGAAQGHFKSIVDLKKGIAEALKDPDCHTNVVEYDSEDYLLDTAKGKQILEDHSHSGAGRSRGSGRRTGRGSAGGVRGWWHSRDKQRRVN